MKYILFTLLLWISLNTTKAAESCFYPSKQDGGVISQFDDCGLIKGDKIQLKKKHIQNLTYDRKGLACIILDTKNLFYFSVNGNSQRAHFYDNGCDYFKDGLARGVVNGKMVFINEALEIILNPGFDLLYPYQCGHAIACNKPFMEKIDGEHTSLKGGKCGLINKHGNLVIEPRYRIEESKIFQNYLDSDGHCLTSTAASVTSIPCAKGSKFAN